MVVVVVMVRESAAGQTLSLAEWLVGPKGPREERLGLHDTHDAALQVKKKSF